MADKITDLYNNLKSTLASELGKYKQGNTESPSIAIVPPQLPAEIKMINGSGLEVIIDKTPISEYKSCASRKIEITYYRVLLIQHKLSGTTEKGINAIARKYMFHRKPVIEPQRQVNGDIDLEQASLTVILH